MTPKLTDRAERMLVAVIKLRKYYRGGYEQGTPLTCPLCLAARCPLCPWVIFEGDSCLRLDYSVSLKRECPDAAWRAKSIKRLGRWERLIRSGSYDKALVNLEGK